MALSNEKREEILQKVKNSPAQKVKLAIADIDGVLRGKYIHLSKFNTALEDGFGFCDVVFGWDSSDICYENTDFTGWHTGYPDAKAKIDLNTFREVPWDQNVPFFLADFEDKEGNSLAVCPRQLLKKVQKECASLGYRSVFSQEFEWFNFREEPNELHDKNFTNPIPITRGMFGYSLLRASHEKKYFNDLFDLLAKFKVPLEGIHTETGPGVYEAAILYDEVLTAADRAVLFKAGVKEIGKLHGIIPTFMAKWDETLPGCGGHLHQSLWEGDRNLFFDEPNKMSELMEHYIAGLLYCLPQVLPMYAPTINSYKRLVEGLWAPTTLTWGIDNRTTAIRALPGSAKSTRIELRVVGSDVNPYLAIAASLASGLYGIKNKLKLEIKPTKGNGYQYKENGVLPASLAEATQKMKESEIASELFGEGFVKHFVQTREWEWKQYVKAVTDWELKRYFEII